MLRSTLLAGLLAGSLALPAVSMARSNGGAVLLRYRYTPGETLSYRVRERLASTSALSPTSPVTTTGLLTFTRRVHVAHISTAGVVTARVSDAAYMLLKITGARRTATKEPRQISTMNVYPDGHMYLLGQRSQAGNGATAALFPGRPVSPGAHWTRRATRILAGFFVSPAVLKITEHLTFTGYRVVKGQRVAVVVATVKEERAARALPTSAWPKARVKVTLTETSTLDINLSSGYPVRTVMDTAITVRELRASHAAPRGWFGLTTHLEEQHI